MDQDIFLKNLAKILGPGAQEELSKIESKQKKEKDLLEFFSASLSKVGGIEINPDEILNPPKPLKVPVTFKTEEVADQQANNTPEPPKSPAKVSNKPVAVTTEDILPPPPPAASGKKQEVEIITSSLKKEIELIKKSMNDFQRMIQHQMQMVVLGGSSHGGGEVRIARLDDVNYGLMKGAADGQVLTYDATNKKWYPSDPVAAASRGYTGSAGATGFVGSQGDVGFVGSEGVGYTGSAGTPGESGFTGSTGVGYTGSKGDQGDIGYIGSKGDQGDIGFVGSQGIQGDIGYTGSEGIQGIAGYVGSQGDMGYVGSQGDIGYVGSQGEIGYVGSEGIQGIAGYVGSQGEMGYAGSEGIQGIAGYVGSQGEIGYVGSQGDIGYVGSEGIRGYTGSIANPSAPVRQSYIADGLTTVYTVDTGYTPHELDVYVNGVKLLNEEEVDISSGNTFTLLYAPEDGSNIEVVGSYIFSTNPDAAALFGPRGYTGSTGIPGTAGGYTGSAGYTGSIANPSAPVRQSYISDGVTDTYTVDTGYAPEQLDIYVNGIKLLNDFEANVSSGSTFTLYYVPEDGSNIDVVGSYIFNSNTVGNALFGPRGYTGSSGFQTQVDWNQTSNVAVDFIKNKPTIDGIIHPTTTVISNNYTIASDDYYIGVNYYANVTLILPGSSTSGQGLIIKDESGNCASNPITISGTIDNNPSGLILSTNYGKINIIYSNGGWRLI